MDTIKTRMPPRRGMKIVAKRLMLHPLCMRLSLLLVSVSVALYGLRYLLGATLTYGLMDLNQYSDTASGIYWNQEGVSILFRMDLTQMILAVPLSYEQLIRFVLMGAVSFLLLAPLRLGAMEGYWNVMRGQHQTVTQVFQWFTQPRRLGKAWVVEFVLGILVRGAGLVAMIPSLYLFYLFYTTTPSVQAYTTASSLLQLGATVLAIAAALFTFWLHSVFLPVRYCLCAHPEYTLGQTFYRGLLSARGVRKAFFTFRLSYLLWFFLSQLTYGIMDLYVVPYTSLGGMLFLQEAARARQQLEEQEDLPQGPEETP